MVKIITDMRNFTICFDQELKNQELKIQASDLNIINENSEEEPAKNQLVSANAINIWELLQTDQ